MLVLRSCCCGLISLKIGTRILSAGSVYSSIMLAFFIEKGSFYIDFAFYAIVSHTIYQMAASFLAFYVTLKERPPPSFLLPFLLFLIYLLWVPLFCMVKLILELKIIKITIVVFIVIAVLFFLGLEVLLIYFIVVVYSYYKELRQRTEPQPQSSPSET